MTRWQAGAVLAVLVVGGFSAQFYDTYLEIRFARECQGKEISFWHAAIVQSNRYHYGYYPLIGEKVCGPAR